MRVAVHILLIGVSKENGFRRNDSCYGSLKKLMIQVVIFGSENRCFSMNSICSLFLLMISFVELSMLCFQKIKIMFVLEDGILM